MCHLIVKVLNPKQSLRFATLKDFKTELISLKQKLASTPMLLRRTLGHPIVEDPEIDKVDESGEQISPKRR